MNNPSFCVETSVINGVEELTVAGLFSNDGECWDMNLLNELFTPVMSRIFSVFR